jgi:hypothetical protein
VNKNTQYICIQLYGAQTMISACQEKGNNNVNNVKQAGHTL